MSEQALQANFRKVLVTGASGYVGGRLVRALINANCDVRVFVRDAKKVASHEWSHQVDIVEGNASVYPDIFTALQGVHTAFYLLHSLNVGPGFEQLEIAMAKTFSMAAKAANVQQIIYLGGILNDTKQSQHLVSRMKTGQALRSSGVPVMEIRAGIIIGSGSASFEILRHLTHRLPIMTTPKWVSNLTQPIAIRDVLYYLSAVANLDKVVEGIYDIGGPEILTYADLMQKFAKVSGLPKRYIIKVPFLTPKLSSLWLGFVTPVPLSLARNLVSSLISEVVADPQKSIDAVIPKPEAGLLTVESAFELAISNVYNHEVETRWSDASITPAPWQKAQSDPDWSGDITMHDLREIKTAVPKEYLWQAIESIGGETGWYGSDFLWHVRGALDAMIGGVGLRRGRRHPKFLRVGDSVDFWRVEDVKVHSHLRLYAEMILPGKAWLEFRMIHEADGIRLIQEATFKPRGLGGHLYWYVLMPFHIFIFPIMIRNIIKTAIKKEKSMKQTHLQEK